MQRRDLVEVWVGVRDAVDSCRHLHYELRVTVGAWAFSSAG
jgi:hypothetical protein